MLFELSLMRSSKETDQKLRWELVTDEGTKFSLYVPKWRVPEPWPGKIWVGVALTPNEEATYQCLTREQALKEPNLRFRPITSCVERYQEKTRTVRFKPADEIDDYEIGEPYIPNELLPAKDAQDLMIEVHWEPKSIGTF